MTPPLIMRGAFLLIFTLIAYPLFGQKVEKLLAKNKVDKAIAYCEKQSSHNRTNCFVSIADYYLSNEDYSAAEEYFNKSEKIEEGYKKIAEACLVRGNYSSAEEYFQKSGALDEGYEKIAERYMIGDVVDSEWVLNTSDAERYLKKIYDDENHVYERMAECFEEYAVESREHAVKFKVMVDLGLISFSRPEGDHQLTTDVKRAYLFFRQRTEVYLDQAAQYYEKIENLEKATQLRGDLEEFKAELQAEASDTE